MIRLVDLLKEIEEDPAKNLSGEDLKKYKQALAILQKQDGTLEEGVRDSLKKLGMSAAVVAALMATPELSKAERDIVRDSASTVQAAGSKAVYSGNPDMDKKIFRDKALEQYKSIPGNKNFWVNNDEDIKKVQHAIKHYRAWTLGRWKQGKGIIVYNGKETRGTDRALSEKDKDSIVKGFMDYVPKTEQDGKNGRFTSRFTFPSLYMSDPNRDALVDLGVQGNDILQQSLAGSSVISVDQMEEWNKFVDWMKNTRP